MGMSADATIAWGVNLNQNEYDEMPEGVSERVEELLEDDWELEKLFGWTEKHPSCPAHLIGKPDRQKDPEFQAWEASARAYRARKRGAIPVEFGHFGSYDYGGKVLFVKRTYTRVNWGVDEVDPVTLVHPSANELVALNKVLDVIGFEGDRTPKLLLFAMYG